MGKKTSVALLTGFAGMGFLMMGCPPAEQPPPAGERVIEPAPPPAPPPADPTFRDEPMDDPPPLDPMEPDPYDLDPLEPDPMDPEPLPPPGAGGS